MRAIQYAAPQTIADAVALLSEYGSRARVLVGGTDLIVQAREYTRDVDLMVDGKRIPELIELTYDPSRGLTLGAAVSCSRIYQDPNVRACYSALVDAASIIGGTAIQSRASVGGNLCNAGPAADSIPALIVYSAVARIAGPAGTREVPVEEFCVAPGKTVLQPDELLVSLHLPAPPSNSGAHYLRFIPRNEMDIAEVGAAASVVLNDARDVILSARVALGAVAPRPLYVPDAGAALAGQPVGDAALELAAKAAGAAAQPISDHRGTAEHRKHLAGVLTRRALAEAIERARGGR